MTLLARALSFIRHFVILKRISDKIDIIGVFDD